MLDFGKCSGKEKKQPKAKTFLVLLLIILCFFTGPWRRGVQKGILDYKKTRKTTIFAINQAEIQQINTRRSYYPNVFFGKVFENKITFIFDKWQKNLFQGLDINYFFFANHPRERAGVIEKEIFYWYWLPVFLIGLYLSIKNSFFIHNLIFIGVLCVICLFNQFDSFIIFLVPLLAVNIFLGLKKIF